MSATAVILIVVAAAVVLGALAFMTLARRSDVRGAGALSAETVKRDRSARSLITSATSRPAPCWKGPPISFPSYCAPIYSPPTT